MNNIFGNPYDITEITVDGQKYLITNEDYRWLIEKLRAVDRQYQTTPQQELSLTSVNSDKK